MEYVLKAGRSLGSGVCRAAGALARGTRRVLAYVPLLGITTVPVGAQDAEEVPMGGEEAENATAASSSPLEEKSEASSPSADEQVAAPVAASAAETKEETAAASPAAASPVEEKKEEPTPSAPTPVPSVEDKKEEAVEKVEAEKKVVEVSQSTGGQSVTDPVEVPVYRVQPVATPSIIERKTSEELPSLPPSSPPPTPIDPSPLQQARQAAASATALAEALKLPAEAVDEEESTLTRVVDATSPSSREENLAESIAITTPAIASLTSPGPSADSPPTIVPAKVECPPVVEARIEFQDAKKVGEILASSRDNEEEAGKVESVSESLVAMEEVSECREEEGDSSDEKSPASNMIETRSMVKNETTVPVVAATDELMNQTLPVVECQIKNEINTRADPMKTNVSSNSGFNENLEAEASTEIETNDACSAAKQHLSSENFKTEKMAAVLDETTRHVERLSDSDLFTVEKCVNVETEESSENLSSVKLVGSSSRELERSEAKAAEQLCGKLIEIEHDYAQDALMESKDERVATVTSPCELFMNSEEGPLSVSEDILVEAIPAMIIPEDDSIEELTDTTESVKVIPETDEERLENEPESDTALPTEETLISEELEDMSVPEESLNEFASVPGIMKDEAKTVDVEDTLRFPPPEDLVEFLQIPEFQGTVSALEPIEEKSIVVSITETETAMTSLAQAEIERCFLSPKDRVTPSDSCPLDSEATQRSRLSDAPTCTLSPGFENVPISLEDLPPAPEDTDSQTLDSFDYPLPPEELSCPSPPVVPANASIIEPPPPSPPASVEHAACPRDPTETLLTPPVSPSSHNSNVNTASGIATNDLTMTNSCDQSDVESKESLAAECPAKTESQDGALCQLSNTIPLTAAQEHHQNAPEVEAPVENNIAHDISTTESLDEAPKVAPPAVPTEAPASPPTAPAITEDVASVTKAIEEIDISDKAVAAAVNEAIECNTNEIIADAHHQNNINE
ncbi:hypothetical protein X777_10339 [Ooceraea biroi]|uniref:Uncharacterized protein n=1 Tax=Ooceraea biroi TaxID=2015173 RepID=A0A026W613_OOCBI|nr:hypothetical protein X777_10339 [Ooceraea biroi]